MCLCVCVCSGLKVCQDLFNSFSAGGGDSTKSCGGAELQSVKFEALFCRTVGGSGRRRDSLKERRNRSQLFSIFPQHTPTPANLSPPPRKSLRHRTHTLTQHTHTRTFKQSAEAQTSRFMCLCSGCRGEERQKISDSTFHRTHDSLVRGGNH